MNNVRCGPLQWLISGQPDARKKLSCLFWLQRSTKQDRTGAQGREAGTCGDDRYKQPQPAVWSWSGVCPLSQWSHPPKPTLLGNILRQHPVSSPLFVGTLPQKEGSKELGQTPGLMSRHDRFLPSPDKHRKSPVCPALSWVLGLPGGTGKVGRWVERVTSTDESWQGGQGVRVGTDCPSSAPVLWAQDTCFLSLWEPRSVKFSTEKDFVVKYSWKPRNPLYSPLESQRAHQRPEVSEKA